VLGQVAVGDKSNEIPAVPQGLKMLSLSGVVVTADAMACQREIARTITDPGSAYVLALKGHQGTLLEDVKLVLDDPALALATAQTTDGEHGRIEVRRAALTSEIAFPQESHAWPGLQAVGKITAMRETQTGTSQETDKPGDTLFSAERGVLAGALSRDRAGALGRRTGAAHWGGALGH
jgi:hypothetical protein